MDVANSSRAPQRRRHFFSAVVGRQFGIERLAVAPPVTVTGPNEGDWQSLQKAMAGNA